MKDTATRAREAHMKKLRRDALQLVFWLLFAFGMVVIVAIEARAHEGAYHNAVLVRHGDGWQVQ